MLIETLIYNSISTVLDDTIPVQRTCFRLGLNCCNNVIALTSLLAF